MKLIAHDYFERGEDLITSTMAGVEQCFGIFGFQPLSQNRKLFFRFLAVE